MNLTPRRSYKEKRTFGKSLRESGFQGDIPRGDRAQGRENKGRQGTPYIRFGPFWPGGDVWVVRGTSLASRSLECPGDASLVIFYYNPPRSIDARTTELGNRFVYSRRMNIYLSRRMHDQIARAYENKGGWRQRARATGHFKGKNIGAATCRVLQKLDFFARCAIDMTRRENKRAFLGSSDIFLSRILFLVGLV